MKVLEGYILSKDILNKNGKPPRIFTVQQFIIWKFVKFPAYTDWSREAVIADKIVTLYPDVEFWNFVDLEFKLNSIAWFLTSKGRGFLRKEKSRKEFIEKEEKLLSSPELEKAPIGENIELSKKKPKTLMDFLK